MSLDPTDNDPVVLWWSLLESVSEIIDDFGREYQHRLISAGPAVVDHIVTSALNELDDSNEPVHFFFDDLHLIEEVVCLQSLHRFFGSLPDGVRVTFTCRGTPPIPLARHRVEGNLLEITGPELALSIEDTSALLTNRGVTLDPKLLDLLVARTEGWPAGVQLASMALAQSEDPAGFVDTFRGTDRIISDYLIGEVLDGLPPDDRRFMTETSVLRQFSGELCDAVTGRTDSSEHLHRLAKSNAFVVPLDRD
ncbi:MAG: hypothetical protein ACR2QK_10850, partial [Acidimicrobiales bacterium]